MSAHIRRRITTRGYRGNTSNRRISIATFGYYPLEDVEVTTYWKEVVKFNIFIEKLVPFGVER